MPVITFTVTGTLRDFGDDPRPGLVVIAQPTPNIKSSDEAVHSTEPEQAITDEDGLFTLELISVPGVWYLIYSTCPGAMNPIRLAGYIPDALDPTTGDVFAPGVTFDLVDIMDESPTPGYEAIAWIGTGIITDHGLLTGLADDDHPQYALADGSRGDFASPADLEAEETARMAADAVLAQAVIDEVDDRIAADQLLADAGALLDGRVDDLEAAIPGLATDAELDAEETARLAGDNALDARVDVLEAVDTSVYATDAELAAGLATKANTVHTHTSGQITDFVEAAQDAVAALLAGASGVTLNYDDAANTLTITGSGSGGLDAEAVRDAIGVALIGTGLITVTVNDALDTITISTTATANSTDATLLDRANHTGEQAMSTVTGLVSALAGKSDTSHLHDDRYYTESEVNTLLSAKANSGHGHAPADITDLEETIRDTIGTALVAGSNIDVTVSDAGNTITIDVEALTSGDLTDFTEATQDVIGAMVAAAGGSYNDAGNTITFPAGSTDTEAVQDIIGAMVAAAGGSYNDGANTITFPAGSTDTEAVQDVIGAMITAAGGSYDDGAGTITLPSAGAPALLLNNGASVPGGTAAGTIVYEKALPPVTYDFTLGSLPAGWAERGTNSESFSGSGMAITSLAANNGYYIDPASPPTEFAVDLHILTQTSVTSIMFGPQIATSGGAGAQANWYNSPNAVMAGLLTGWAYGSSFTQEGSGPPSYPTVLRLRRAGALYFASHSADGGVTWSGETPSQLATAGTRIGFGCSFGTANVTVQKVIYRPGFNGRPMGAKGWWDGSALQPLVSP